MSENISLRDNGDFTWTIMRGQVECGMIGISALQGCSVSVDVHPIAGHDYVQAIAFGTDVEFDQDRMVMGDENGQLVPGARFVCVEMSAGLRERNPDPSAPFKVFAREIIASRVALDRERKTGSSNPHALRVDNGYVAKVYSEVEERHLTLCEDGSWQ